VFLAPSPVLSLYATARTTGTVLESGAGATHSVSIYEGKMIQDSCIRMETSGNDIDEFVKQEFKSNGNSDFLSSVTVFSHATSGLQEDKKTTLDQVDLNGIARNVKESLGYVSINYLEELSKPVAEIERKYELPDGSHISITQERFKCSEAMFEPILIGKEEPGIHQIITASIEKCDESLKAELCKNIVLGGGNCLFPGLKNRLTKEMLNLNSSFKVKVITPPEMKYSAWVGGSILSSMPSFENKWISKEDFDERPHLLYTRLGLL
jgi:actin